jgi:hypothetical protein
MEPFGSNVHKAAGSSTDLRQTAEAEDISARNDRIDLQGRSSARGERKHQD